MEIFTNIPRNDTFLPSKFKISEWCYDKYLKHNWLNHSKWQPGITDKIKADITKNIHTAQISLWFRQHDQNSQTRT